VPSIGSTIQRTPLRVAPEAPSPYSSPSTESSGRSAANASRICRSTARSAAVTTSVTVLLVAATTTPSARIRYAVSAASRATSTAMVSSSDGVVAELVMIRLFPHSGCMWVGETTDPAFRRSSFPTPHDGTRPESSGAWDPLRGERAHPHALAG
jgi:hypothetical protein